MISINIRSPKVPKNEPFVLCRAYSKHNEPILACGNDLQTSNQFFVSSYFDAKEELLLLPCLFGESSYPMAFALLGYGVEVPLHVEKNIEDIKRSGIVQENLCLFAICDSTHSSLRGIGFIEFLKKILGNLNSSSSFNRSYKFDVNEEIEKSLRNLTVPFLLPSNMKPPEVFEKLFPKGNSLINIGEYTRTPDCYNIDSTFDLTIIDEQLQKAKAIMEAKNWSDDLDVKGFVEIVEKGIAFKRRPQNSGIKFPIHLTLLFYFKHFQTNFEKRFKQIDKIVK